MEYSGLVQSVGRPGESVYIFSTPSYQPIPPVPKVDYNQNNFSGNGSNGYLSHQKAYESFRKTELPEDFRSRAASLQLEAKRMNTSVSPGSLLNIIA